MCTIRQNLVIARFLLPQELCQELCSFFPSIANLRCFATSVSAVHIYSTVSDGSMSSRIGGGCHEANDHCRDNGFTQSGGLCLCTDQGLGCDRSAVEPE